MPATSHNLLMVKSRYVLLMFPILGWLIHISPCWSPNVFRWNPPFFQMKSPIFTAPTALRSVRHRHGGLGRQQHRSESVRGLEQTRDWPSDHPTFLIPQQKWWKGGIDRHAILGWIYFEKSLFFLGWFLLISGSELGLQPSYRRKFRSQTSDNMDRWKAEQGRGREKRKIRRKKMQMREKVGKSRNCFSNDLRLRRLEK